MRRAKHTSSPAPVITYWTTPPTCVGRSAWQALAAHDETVRNLHLRQLFAANPRRAERMALESLGLYLDYSKNRITDETLALLVRLAEESDLRELESGAEPSLHHDSSTNRLIRRARVLRELG